MAGLATFWIDHPVDGSLEAQRIRVEQIGAIAGHIPIAAAANLINSLLTVVVFWGSVRTPILIVLVAVVWMLSFARLHCWLIHRRRPNPDRSGHRAVRRATLWAVVMGSLWGGIAACLFPTASHALQVFLAFVSGAAWRRAPQRRWRPCRRPRSASSPPSWRR